MKLKLKKLHPDFKLPSYAHPGDAGMDVYALEDYELNPGERRMIPLGFMAEFPEGYMVMVKDRSGLAKNSGLHCLGGVIDAGYRGEYAALLINLGLEKYRINKGDKIAQLIVFPIAVAEIEEVEEFSDSSRKEGGFGSTGLN